MFKRAPIIVVGIIVVLLLVSPFAIGLFTENSFRQRIETESMNPYLSTSIESYDRGWFTSRVRLSYGLSDNYVTELEALGAVSPVSTLSSAKLPVIVEIAHGPILLKNGFEIGSAAVKAYVDPDAPMVSLAQQVLGLPYLIELRGRSGFGSGFEFEGDVPPAKGNMADFDYDFSGIDFSGRLNGDDLRFDAMLANCSVQSPFASAILDSLTINGDYEHRPGQVTLGTGGIAVTRFTATNPLVGGEPSFSLDNASATGSVDEDETGTTLDIKAVYRLGQLAAGELALHDAAIGLNFNHIDEAAMNRLYSLASNASGGLDESQMRAQIMPILEDVLAGDPSISVEPLQFSMTDGDFNGRIGITVDSSALPTDQASVLQNPMALVGALSAEADITASKPVAERLAALAAERNMPATGPDGQAVPDEQRESMAHAQATQMLQFLSTQGLLVDNGDSYSTSIRLADGTVTANGQPLPFGF